MGDSSYKGVSATQDSRFSNKESLLLRKLSFPAHFSTKVDMTKVELTVIRPWISRRVTELLGFEDDVVPEYAVGMLEEERYPDARKIQIQLMGFLEGKTAEFMSELWELLVSAQESPGGVPRRFVEDKKEELRLKREEGERVVREARERAQRAERGVKSEDAGRRSGSRWDAGARERDTRPPAYIPSGRDEYRPREYRRRDHRDGAGRSRDSGWGSRAPREAATYPSRRSPSPPPPRHRRRSPSPARSPSPPPRHRRRSPSPPPRSRRRSPSPARSPPPQRNRQRSRSRSVTPDYRATLRDRKKQQSSDRARDNADGPSRATHRDERQESERERELRDKLLRAKGSRRRSGDD